MPARGGPARPRRPVRRPRGADRRALRHARAARAQDPRPGRASEPLSAHEIAQALWGNVAVTQAYLTLQRGARPRRPAARARRRARDRARRRRALRGDLRTQLVDGRRARPRHACSSRSSGCRRRAARSAIPYPIVLVLGGLVLGFLPGVPDAELDPELVLVIFLPPLLYSAAFFASLRDLKADLRSDLAAGHRAGRRDGGGGRGRRARADRRPAVGGGVRARRDRGADRPGGGDGDRAAAEHPAARDQHPRGREPDQRRHRAGALPGRGRRGRRLVLAGRRRAGVRARRGWAGSPSASRSAG